MTLTDLADLAQRDLLDAAQDTGAYVVIVGGQAVRHYGYQRYTEDVDGAVDHKHVWALADEIQRRRYEWRRFAGFLFEHPNGRQIDLLPEGLCPRPSAAAFPHPSRLGENKGFADFSALCVLKLQAARSQDDADIADQFQALYLPDDVQIPPDVQLNPPGLHSLQRRKPGARASQGR